MPLFRLLIIALIVGIGFYLYRRLTIKPPAPKPKPPQARPTQAVKCELCGLHVPEHEAIRRDNHSYCCQDHADKAAQ